MPLIDVTNDNYDDLLEQYPIIIFDFWAEWCGPCRFFAPIFADAASRHSEILFGKINTESEPELVAEYKVFSMPTLIAIRDGTIEYARPGTLTADKLEKLIQDLRSGTR